MSWALLLNSTGATISTDDNSAGSPNFRLTYTATAAATLFVKVTGKTTTTTGGYGLTTTFSGTPTTSVGDIDIRNGTAVVPMNGSIDFGTRALNVAALNKTITIANTGKAALAINSVSISGTGFSIVTQPATSIAAAKTTGVTVAFKPTAAGAQSAVLTIVSNDPDENPFTVNLTGTGSGGTTGDDHGNSIATATKVSVPSSTKGVVNTGTDLDFFSFTLTSSRSVTIRSTGAVDTWGTLYNASGSIITEADDTSSTNYNFTITRTLAAGTYYVSVEGYASTDTGAFGLTLQ